MLTEQHKAMAKGAMITIPVQLYNALMEESDKLTGITQELANAKRVIQERINQHDWLKEVIKAECERKGYRLVFHHGEETPPRMYKYSARELKALRKRK